MLEFGIALAITAAVLIAASIYEDLRVKRIKRARNAARLERVLNG